MDEGRLRVLFIRTAPGRDQFVQRWLAEAAATAGELSPADGLAAGLERLAGGGIDVLLLELAATDAHGLETLTRVRQTAPRVPSWCW